MRESKRRGGGYWPLPASVAALSPLALLVSAWFQSGLPQSVTARCGIIALSLSASALALVRYRTRPGLDPLTWANVTLFALFVLHPLATLWSGVVSEPYRLEFDLSPGYIQAANIALVGTLALNGAYWLSPPRKYFGSPRLILVETQVMTRAAVALIFIGLGAYMLFALSTGQGLKGLAGGLKGNNSLGSSAYLYEAPFLLLPAGLLLLGAWLERRRAMPFWGMVLVFGFLVYNLLPTGQRLVLISTVSGFAIFILRKLDKRMPILILAGSLVLSFFVLVALQAVGHGTGNTAVSSSLARTVGHPLTAVKRTFTTEDTEMFDGLAVESEVVPSRLPYDPGHTLLSLLSAAIPRSLWPGKVAPGDGIVDAYLLGSQGISAHSAAIAFSPAGELYYDSGLIGVALGFGVIGVLLRRLSDWGNQNRGGLADAYYAATVPLTIVLLRGNFEDTAARYLFIAFPLLLLLRIHRRRDERRLLRTEAGAELVGEVGRVRAR